MNAKCAHARHEVSWRKGVPEDRPRVSLRKPAPSSAFFGTPLFLFEQQKLQSPQHASGHSSIHVLGAFPCFFMCDDGHVAANLQRTGQPDVAGRFRGVAR